MTQRTILIAEDQGPIRDLIRTHLEGAGHAVLAVKNGTEAIAYLYHKKIAAAVLDINMPELDGFQVLKVISQTPALAQMPVLILTARDSVDDVRRAIVLGAKDYLTKPFSERQLVARVNRLLRTPIAPPETAKTS